MKFADIERLLDYMTDAQQVAFLESIIPQLRGAEARSAMIVLANLYVLQEKFKKAAEMYEIVGFQEDAAKARARISA